MGEEIKVIDHRQRDVIVPQAISYDMLIQVAVQQGADLAKLERLMDLKERFEANEARKAFHQAMSEFKKVPITIAKDKVNAQYKSKYAGIGNIVGTINAAMAPFGLNARWSFTQEEKITVTCVLSHTLGHSESVSLSGVPDTSGSKNLLQQIKSTITYLESATFQAVTGIVASDEDDDGNGSGQKVAVISESQALDLETMVTDTKADKAAFFRYFKIESFGDLPAQKYGQAIAMLKKKGGA